MPNCDFYATPEDHEPVLGWLFSEDECDVYEMYSDFDDTYRDLQSPRAWHFERIESFSRRLNRQIRSHAVAKLGSRVVLPGALACWDRGISLGPYQPGQHDLIRLKSPA